MLYTTITIQIKLDESKLTAEQRKQVYLADTNITIAHPVYEGAEDLHDAIAAMSPLSYFNYLGEGRNAITIRIRTVVDEGDIFIETITPQNHTVSLAEVFEGDYIEDGAREANAHLMAAAPDLLDFVLHWAGHTDSCDCLDDGSPRTDCTCGYDKARDRAIAKAQS